MTTRFIRSIFVAVLIFANLIAVGSPAATQAQAQQPEPPGVLIDVGGYKLHLYCAGEGSPTVILEPGFARSSLNMRGLQEQIAPLTRVCAYDHAGFGWSEAGPLPRTTTQIVSELETLLLNANISGPYVLVAHSFGGFAARLFASRNPHQVVGLVLAEATPPEFLEKYPLTLTALEPALRSLLQTANAGSWTPATLAPIFTILDDVAPELQPTYIELAKSPRFIEAALAELQAGIDSAAQVRAAALPDDLPITVLLAGARLKLINEQETDWVRAQAAQADLSSNGRLIVVWRSGHSIQVDQPAAIVEAVRGLASDINKTQ